MNMEKFTTRSQELIKNAVDLAVARRHQYVTPLYLLLAMLALVWTLKTCVPAVDAAITKIAGAAQKTKTVQAFSALTERLREGEAVQEALSGSFEILTGAGD